jgi:transposase
MTTVGKPAPRPVFGLEHFTINWEHRRTICPEGHTSSEWTPHIDHRGNDSIYIRFAPSD